MEVINMQVPTSTGYKDITLLNEHGLWVNATQMAKPFGKKPADWLRLSTTKRWLREIGGIKNAPLTQLVKKAKKSAATGGKAITWLQEDAAMEFARWLSPAFTIWSNERTKELLLTGHNAVTQQEPNALPLNVFAPLVSKLALFEESVHEQARKLDYHDLVLQSKTLITTTTIAKELGISAVALNKLLHDRQVIYKSNNHWVLYAGYSGKGYTGTKTAIFQDSGGNYQSSIHTYWTEKGRAFIHALLKEEEKAA